MDDKQEEPNFLAQLKEVCAKRSASLSMSAQVSSPALMTTPTVGEQKASSQLATPKSAASLSSKQVKQPFSDAVVRAKHRLSKHLTPIRAPQAPNKQAKLLDEQTLASTDGLNQTPKNVSSSSSSSSSLSRNIGKPLPNSAQPTQLRATSLATPIQRTKQTLDDNNNNNINNNIYCYSTLPRGANNKRASVYLATTPMRNLSLKPPNFVLPNFSITSYVESRRN